MKKIITIFLLTILSINLLACGSNSPKDAATTMLDALRNGEVKSFKNSIINNGSSITFDDVVNEEASEMVKTFYGELEYKVLDVEEVNDNEAIVYVKAELPDFSPMINKMMSSLFELMFSEDFLTLFTNPEALEKRANEIMNEIMHEDIGRVTKHLEIHCVKDGDGDYKVLMDKKLVEELLLGSMLEVFNGMDELFKA